MHKQLQLMLRELQRSLACLPRCCHVVRAVQHVHCEQLELEHLAGSRVASPQTRSRQSKFMQIVTLHSNFNWQRQSWGAMGVGLWDLNVLGF
jgi:hypothetical protein